MPLTDGYGVVIGTLERYHRDPVNDYGQYFHGNVEVRTPAGVYRCAIDVDSKFLPNGVEWRIVELGRSSLKGLAALGNGWHSLPSNSTSGALDYIRSHELRPRLGCVFVMFSPFLQWLIRLLEEMLNPWKQGTSIDALNDLEPLLQNPKRLFIFGEPFTRGGLGLHNIHQNQGDPVTSQWSHENGIWQDGATLIERQDGTIVAFLNKFKSQSYRTNDQGKPL